MLLMIDNYDSFTYNLVQYFQRLDVEVLVKRNDEISCAQVKVLKPKYLVVSPGPCTPNEAGISLELINQFKGHTPILGVCLGHQTIAQSFGAKIIRAKKVMHGKTSKVMHNNKGVFKGLASPLTVCRYHSLVVDPKTLPEALEVTAWLNNEENELSEIMGFKHRSLALEGVQFHPEAILTESGLELLDNFIKQYR